jgi:hypothetical protein
MRWLIRFAFSMFLVAAAGCGGAGGGSDDGDDAAAEDVAIDNCSLVTEEEASALTGVKLTRGEDSPLGCPFTRPGQTMSTFTVRAFRGKGPAKDNFGSVGADTTIHEIEGVGDSAAALTAGSDHVNFLIVQRGNRYIQLVTTFVRNIDLGSPKLKEAQDLALKALDRMP